MKKFVALICSSLSSLTLAAKADSGKTKLELKAEGYEYTSDNREVKIDFDKLNKDLNERGLAGLPKVVVMSDTNAAAYARLLAKRVDAANEVSGRDMHFNFYNQGSGETYLYQMTLCYRGAITGIPDLIQKLRGHFLHSEEGILAIGAGKNKQIYDKAFKSRAGLRVRYDSEYESNLENINQWLTYDTKSDTALVMSDFGPQGDGTELKATLVPPCE